MKSTFISVTEEYYDDVESPENKDGINARTVIAICSPSVPSVIKSAEIEIEIADRDSGTVLVSRQTNKNFLQTNKNFQTN